MSTTDTKTEFAKVADELIKGRGRQLFLTTMAAGAYFFLSASMYINLGLDIQTLQAMNPFVMPVQIAGSIGLIGAWMLGTGSAEDRYRTAKRKLEQPAIA